jgi:Short C-terminal domain
MGLIRGVARTAAIAGTATAVSNRVSRRQAGRWAEQEQQQAYQQQPVYQQPAYQEPPPQPPPAMSTEPPPPAEQEMGDKLAQLQQLGALKSQGILTDEEFEAQKKKILGG